MDASIIIASLRLNELKRCLDSIHQCSEGIDYEVVVVSPFDVEPHPRVVHVKEKKAEGNYNAVAKGYKKAKGEYVVVLSDDLVVTQGWLSNMIAFMRPHDNEIFQGRFRHMVVHETGGQQVMERPLMNYFGFMFSGFPCMRRDRIDRIGGLFDNKLLHGFWGDPDLGLRVWTNGGRVETCRDSVIVAYPCLDELDRTSKERWQEADGDAFCQRWEPVFGELFAIFDVYGQRIECSKCGEEYRWHSGDKRRCWHCGKLAYPIMLKGGEAVASWVSIVVPHTGPVELLKNCLEGIATTSVPHDIIVIEDRPDTETRKYLDSLSGDIEVVVNAELMGVEQALNNGFGRARGKHICMLTTSYELSPGSIDAMKAALEEHPEFGWVALPLEDRMAFVAGCSMMTREAWQGVGSWDEAYSVGYGFSDDDYMRRMWKAGYKPHIVDGPRMRHKGKTATEVVRGEQKAREGFAKAQALFQQRYGEPGTNWDSFPVYKETKVLTATALDKNSWIRSRCLPSDTILDVGSADGWVWENQPYKVMILLDINEFVPHPKYPRAVGDAHKLPYEDKAFDIVVEGELLEHVYDPELCLREAVRVASKKVVLTVPAEDYWAPENRPFVPIEEVLKETGLTKEEQFRKDNPHMVVMNDLAQGYHRRHYTREALEAQLKHLQLPYRVELLRYSGWAFWVAEVYCDGGEPVIEAPKVVADKIKLNLGSFVDTFPGWWNVDILNVRQHIPPEHLFKQCDLRRGIPWPDGSVDLIRCSHLLEHLTLEEGKNLLREIWRCLKPGGLLRIATPDARTIIRHFIANDMAYFNAVEQPPEYVMAGTQCEKLSMLLYSLDYSHKAVYDYNMLKSYLEQAGFSKVFRSVAGFSHSEAMMMETVDQHSGISLYVEAVK